MTRQRSLLVGTLMVAPALLPAGIPAATGIPAPEAWPARPGGWTAAWAAAMQPPKPGWTDRNWSQEGFAGRVTLRQVVRVTAGGTAVRIRLSNLHGTRPLTVVAATVARSGRGASVAAGTSRTLSFAGHPGVTIPAGGVAASDAARVPASPLESLSVTTVVDGPTGPATFHENGLTTTYRATGDRREDVGGGGFSVTSRSWYYLAGVDVSGRPVSRSPRPAGAVVAFGDSLVDGYGARPGLDERYPDELAERLVANRAPFAVVNAGINGNKLLTDSPCFGEKGTTRLERDVLGQPGVRAVIVSLGLNDIGSGGFPGSGCGPAPVVTAADVIDGHRRIIGRARARGLRVIGTTLTPMKGNAGYHSAAKEAVRDAVNRWIRGSGAYDAVVDLDRTLAEPTDPDALRRAYDSGDHLHPNTAGRAAMAAAAHRALRELAADRPPAHSSTSPER